jgi:tartrate dehydrogenase/decarboxylase / D-malate dehydrogenase
VVAQVASDYADVELEKLHIDAAAAAMVTRVESFDVLVGSNLFMDILSDLGPAVAGSLGMAASANINPARTQPSMFEPVHGSAPDIAGRGIANPIGALWSGAMMLDFLGEGEAHGQLMRAIEKTLAAGVKTRDLGGAATTREFTAGVMDHL